MKRNRSGQQLVEFVMVMPVLIIALLFSFWGGSAFVAATDSSSAIKRITRNTIVYANDSKAPKEPWAAAFSHQVSNKAISGGAVLHKVILSHPDRVFGVLIGEKNYRPNEMKFLEQFNFTLTELINTQVMEENKGDAVSASYLPTAVKLPHPASYDVGIDDATVRSLMVVPLGSCLINRSTIDAIYADKDSYKLADGFYSGARGVPSNYSFSAPTSQGFMEYLLGDNVTRTGCDGEYGNFYKNTCQEQCEELLAEAGTAESLETCQSDCAYKQTKFCKAAKLTELLRDVAKKIEYNGGFGETHSNPEVTFTVRKED